MKTLNRLYSKWIRSRQISACREMLTLHAHALGPEHEKEIRSYMTRLYNGEA